MLSTIKSVEEYTGINLYALYNSRARREQIVQKRLLIDSESSLTIDDIDADFEARQHIKRAQSIVEAYVGKDEIDIDNPIDLMILDKMVSYQAIYMVDNEDIVFNQIASNSINIGGSVQNFDRSVESPYIAPLALLAAKGLSWKKAKSIKTGKIFQFPKITKWRNV